MLSPLYGHSQRHHEPPTRVSVNHGHIAWLYLIKFSHPSSHISLDALLYAISVYGTPKSTLYFASTGRLCPEIAMSVDRSRTHRTGRWSLQNKQGQHKKFNRYQNTKHQFHTYHSILLCWQYNLLTFLAVTTSTAVLLIQYFCSITEHETMLLVKYHDIYKDCRINQIRFLLGFQY